MYLTKCYKNILKEGCCRVLQHAAVGAAVACAGDLLGAIEENLNCREEVANGVVLHEFEAVGDRRDGAVSPA
jgi:hypothetical protein